MFGTASVPILFAVTSLFNFPPFLLRNLPQQKTRRKLFRKAATTIFYLNARVHQKSANPSSGFTLSATCKPPAFYSAFLQWHFRFSQSANIFSFPPTSYRHVFPYLFLSHISFLYLIFAKFPASPDGRRRSWHSLRIRSRRMIFLFSYRVPYWQESPPPQEPKPCWWWLSPYSP